MKINSVFKIFKWLSVPSLFVIWIGVVEVEGHDYLQESSFGDHSIKIKLMCDYSFQFSLPNKQVCDVSNKIALNFFTDNEDYVEVLITSFEFTNLESMEAVGLMSGEGRGGKFLNYPYSQRVSKYAAVGGFDTLELKKYSYRVVVTYTLVDDSGPHDLDQTVILRPETNKYITNIWRLAM